MAKKQPVKPKERGCLLTGIIVVMVVHGIMGTAAYYSIRTQEALDRPWLISLMVLHSILNIIAAFGIWNWKRWGIELLCRFRNSYFGCCWDGFFWCMVNFLLYITPGYPWICYKVEMERFWNG